MPPMRTYPAVQPTKSERSHEENQERAYIAASRRSDRSLEARVESARRASEIHKRRTGRSLRVTEQDVINEEMYEEEEDDLPAHYRRLNAQLNNSGSADFNRRLTAYLSNHLAMRSALEQALSSSYQQFPNGTPWAQSMQHAGSASWSQNMPPPIFNDASLSPQLGTNRSPSFRQAPYPMPNPNNLRPQMDNQPPSVTSPAKDDTNITISRPAEGPSASHPRPTHSRRASEPAHLLVDNKKSPFANNLNIDNHNNNNNKSLSLSPLVEKSRPTNAPGLGVNGSGTADLRQGFSGDFSQQSGSALLTPLSLPPSNKSDPNSLGPLSTALPPETQMFTNAAFDPTDPFGSRMWNSIEKPDSFWADSTLDSQMKHPALFGMNQTLAPSALDTDSSQLNWPESPSKTPSVPFSAPPFTYNFDLAFSDNFLKPDLHLDDQQQPSGQMTPGEKDWNAFIDQSTWDESTT